MGRHARARHERADLPLVLEQPGTTQAVGEECLGPDLVLEDALEPGLRTGGHVPSR